MKLIKIFIILVIMALTGAASAQKDYEAMFRKALEYKGTEWSVIPLDEDYEEKVFFLWSDNKNGDAEAKIIIPEFEGGNTMMLLLTNVNCEYIKTLKITIGDTEYPLRKIGKGQAKDKDTFFANYSVFPKNRNMIAELFCHGADSGTMIGLNTIYPTMLDIKNTITIEVPFEDSTFTFTFSPTKAVK